MPTTEAIDRLYLELSQFTNAKTAREIKLEGLIKRSWEWIGNASEDGLDAVVARSGERLRADLLAALKQN